MKFSRIRPSRPQQKLDRMWAKLDLTKIWPNCVELDMFEISQIWPS